MAQAKVYLVDDDVEPVLILSRMLKQDLADGVDTKWFESLSELHVELRKGASPGCVVFLDSMMALGATRDELEASLARRDSSLLSHVGTPELSGLLFVSVIRDLCPDAWIILHSAYSERIAAACRESPSLASLRTSLLDDAVWKTSTLTECVAAILRGMEPQPRGPDADVSHSVDMGPGV